MINARGTSGESYDFFFFDAANRVWSTAAGWTDWADADYANYRRPATELGATGCFSTDRIPSGFVRWELRQREATLSDSVVASEGGNTLPTTTKTQARIAGRSPTARSNALSGTTGGRTFAQTAPNIYSARCDGPVSLIRLYSRAAKGGVVKFLVFRAGAKVAETRLFDIHNFTVSTLLEFRLETPLYVQSGDVIGCYLKCDDSSTSDIGVNTLTGGVIKYATGDLSSLSSLTSTSADFEMEIEFVGDAPTWCITGDSIAEGHNGASSYHGVMHAGATLPGEKSSSVGYWVDRFTGETHSNLALGGMAAQWVAETGIPECLKASPKSIVVHVGVNDISSGRQWTHVKTYFDSIRSQVPLSTRLIFNEILPWTGGSDTYAARIREFNSELDSWCKSNHASLVKCHDVFAKVRSSTGYLDDMKAEYVLADNIHLTTLGVQLLAKLVAYELKGGIELPSIELSPVLAKENSIRNVFAAVV